MKAKHNFWLYINDDADLDIMNKRSETSLTLRQIEVMRAVMISGSITGASKMLNVSQPGISRTMKHLESSLGVALFTRTGGRYVPTPAAQQVFLQMQEIDKKLRDLNFSIAQLERGHDVNVSLASVPSIAHVMVPACCRPSQKTLSRYSNEHRNPQDRGSYRLSSFGQRGLCLHELSV